MKFIYCFLFLTILIPGTASAQNSINPCAAATPVHIVVLGSSTAAGSGPSTPDSAWVNRYRNYLQSVNPLNQVTNLAIGGTTTYHIMPDWFVPPPGRPAANPNNNVSKAVALSADAIIVNMPSNDAANNFVANEQMFNFITISQVADSAGIPVWICTTQPRNFSLAQKLIQTTVRDSIFSYFGSMAIDFWNGIADTTDGILPQYNSGDGVHLNDAGHAILFSRVEDASIPDFIADTLSYTDHVINMWVEDVDFCGDSTTIINAVVVNTGTLATDTVSVTFEIEDQTMGGTTYGTMQLTGLMQSCDADTVSYTLNTYSGVDLLIRSYINTNDSIKSNDTSQYVSITTSGHPVLSVTHDTVCSGQSGLVTATSIALGDTVIWYDSFSGGSIIGFGQSYSTVPLIQDTTIFAKAVRGPLHYHNSLFTTSTTTTNWNGIMFDVVATDSIIIDSLTLRVNSAGVQNVIAYKRNGSHVGFENNMSAWSTWDTISLNVFNSGDIMMLDISDETLNTGDTLGIYLHMMNPGSNLSYLAVGNPVVTSNSEMQIFSGSGIDYTFGALHTPRNYSGTVYYHFGFNPEGDCSSERIAVQAIVSQPAFNLGNDTTISISQVLILNGPAGYGSYLWSNGDTTETLVIDSTSFTTGNFTIWLQVTDVYGCMTSDTIIVTLTGTSGILENEIAGLKVYPNPSKGKLIVELNKLSDTSYILSDLTGKQIKNGMINDKELDFSAVEKGMYSLEIHSGQTSAFIKLILY